MVRDRSLDRKVDMQQRATGQTGTQACCYLATGLLTNRAKPAPLFSIYLFI